MELLQQEIKSLMRILLKTMPCWLISETRVEKRLKSRTRRGLAIVITVRNSAEALILCAKGSRFEEVLKMVEKYWEARPSSVCMSYTEVGHNRLGECGDKSLQCVLCARDYKAKNCVYEVTKCNTKKGKICAHDTPKCANCGGND